MNQQYLPDELVGRRYYVPGDQGHERVLAERMAEREEARKSKPKRKSRPTPPMASLSDAMRPRETARKDLADTQKKDASS